jgi:hypothetical protein
MSVAVYSILRYNLPMSNPVSFRLPVHTVRLIASLASDYEIKRSAVIAIAVNEFAKKLKGKENPEAEVAPKVHIVTLEDQERMKVAHPESIEEHIHNLKIEAMYDNFNVSIGP